MAKVMLIPLSSTFLLVACCKTKLCVIIVKLLLFLAMVAPDLSPVPTYSAFDIPCLFPFICRGAPTIKSSGQFSKCSFTMMHLFYLSFTTRGNPWESYRANAFEWMVQETIQLLEYEIYVWRCGFDNWGKLTPAHRAGAPSGWVDFWQPGCKGGNFLKCIVAIVR